MSKYFTIIANFIKLISYLKFVDFLTGNLNVQVYEIFHHLFTDCASLHVISIEFYG